MDESTTDQFVDVIAGSCNFVSDWESIVATPGNIIVFESRAAKTDANQIVSSEIESDFSKKNFFARSTDQ